MTVLAPIGANLVLLCTVLSLGSLLRPIMPEDSRRVDRAAIILVGGLGLTGTLLFCVGLIHFSVPWIVLTLCGGAALGMNSLLAEIREWRQQPALAFPGLGSPSGYRDRRVGHCNRRAWRSRSET